MSKNFSGDMTTEQRRALAAQVRKLRQDRGWSQSELAELANVTRQTVSNLERGTVPQLETLRRLLDVLGVETAAVEFDEQTQMWLTMIGTLIEAIPSDARRTAVDESIRVLASHVRPAGDSVSAAVASIEDARERRMPSKERYAAENRNEMDGEYEGDAVDGDGDGL